MTEVVFSGSYGHLTLDELVRKCAVIRAIDREALFLDLSRIRFFSPVAMACVRAAISDAVAKGRLHPDRIQVRAPKGDRGRYLERMDVLRGYWEPPVMCRRNEAIGFTPAQDFSSDDDADRIAEVLETTAGARMDDEGKQVLLEVVGELMHNTVDHADTYGGVVTAQSWPTRNVTEIAIADGGCGVIHSMRRNANYAHLDDLEIMSIVSSPHVTSTGKATRGNGLARLAGYVKHYGGSLSIQSGNVRHTTTKNADELHHLSDAGWGGTLVVWQVDTASPQPLAVLKS